MEASFLNKAQLLEILKSNMDKFDSVSLSRNGGWPSFDNLEISLLSQKNSEDEQCYKLMLFYECITGSSCFMADNRREQDTRHIYIKNGQITKIL